MKIDPKFKRPTLKHHSPPPRDAAPNSKEQAPVDKLEEARPEERQYSPLKKALLTGGILAVTATSGAQAQAAESAVELLQAAKDTSGEVDLAAHQELYQETFRQSESGEVRPDRDPPQTAAEALPYKQALQRARETESYIRDGVASLQRLKRLDNSIKDLNPEPGVVVLHDHWNKQMGEQELSQALLFDPISGDLLEYSSQTKEQGRLRGPGLEYTPYTREVSTQWDFRDGLSIEARDHRDAGQDSDLSYSDHYSLRPAGEGKIEVTRRS